MLYGRESWTIRKAERRTDSDSDSEALYLAHWPYKINTYRCIHKPDVSLRLALSI